MRDLCSIPLDLNSIHEESQLEEQMEDLNSIHEEPQLEKQMEDLNSIHEEPQLDDLHSPTRVRSRGRPRKRLGSNLEKQIASSSNKNKRKALSEVNV
ncbi:hypothetical protein PIB30_034299 [Stylosanthes scabra]|uniref:Uncharacterized protein n=1 Tax=Stylosanthes scabra TaxID=79078 RepID=A0ABU6QCN7_9FABA|nr:hypothetical protein [Stylosanthes scabra]